MRYPKVIPNENAKTFSYNTLYLEQNVAFVNLKITLDFQAIFCLKIALARMDRSLMTNTSTENHSLSSFTLMKPFCLQWKLFCLEHPNKEILHLLHDSQP